MLIGAAATRCVPLGRGEGAPLRVKPAEGEGEEDIAGVANATCDQGDRNRGDAVVRLLVVINGES